MKIARGSWRRITWKGTVCGLIPNFAYNANFGHLEDARICLIQMVGAAGFELATPCSQSSFLPPARMAQFQGFRIQWVTHDLVEACRTLWAFWALTSTELSTAPSMPSTFLGS